MLIKFIIISVDGYTLRKVSARRIKSNQIQDNRVYEKLPGILSSLHKCELNVSDLVEVQAGTYK